MRWLYGVALMSLAAAPAAAQSVYMDPSNRPDYRAPIVRPAYEAPRPAWQAPEWERQGRPVYVDPPRRAYEPERRQEGYGAPVDVQGRRR